MSQVAKIFTNGRSQAVRLPAAFRFNTAEVFIRQDPETGDVVLSRKPRDWGRFLEALQSNPVPPEFLGPDDRQQGEVSRDPLEGWMP